MSRPGRFLAASLALALAAPAAWAQGSGTLTAVFDPGARALIFLWKDGPAIDELRLIVPARLAERLHAAAFPSGWYLSREAGSLTLRGPATPPPARFRLELAEGKVPRELAVEVRGDDRPVFYADDLPVGAAPRPAASLDGLLRLPPAAAPGETILVQVLDPERTPPAGRWTIAGADAVPFDPRVSTWDPARARRVELELAETVAAHPGRTELARLAAALAAEEPARRRARYLVRALSAADLDLSAGIEEEEFTVEELPVEGEEAAEPIEEPPSLEAEIGMGAEPAAPERGPAAAYAVAVADPEPFGLAGEAEVFTVSRRDGGELLADVGLGEEGVRLYEVAAADSADLPPRIVAVAPSSGGETGEPAGPFLAVVPAAESASLAFEVAAVEPLPPSPPAELLATLLTAELPADLAPEVPLLVTYTDSTGEVTVEATAGIQVARRGKGQPRLDGAAATGDGVCVCGRFPGALAWRGLTLDGTPAFPLAASGQAAWLPLPPDLAPGRHTVAALPAAGFPRGEEVAFEVIADLPADPEAAFPPESCSCLEAAP
ncbi:MAG TPA: hypothetical protein VNJ70_18145 [Thermoanaerobaculia bacterium]|nr:hypothetical protein [Thermoanaerobaculia bacterium]